MHPERGTANLGTGMARESCRIDMAWEKGHGQRRPLSGTVCHAPRMFYGTSTLSMRMLAHTAEHCFS